MKLMHISDLHLGKTVNGFRMTDDQRYILGQLINITRTEAPDAVLIAGDVYDKPQPPTDAVELFDTFLHELSQLADHIFVISGNHDSAERIAFGARLMNPSGVHMSPVYSGEVTPFTLTDEYGAVDIFMLPFVKPANIRHIFPDENAETYTDAVRAAIRRMNIDPEHRSVIIAHQFVTGAVRSDSETVSVGGSDNVDSSVFCEFDYVALGHLHAPQSVGENRIRYCGSPLKYSFSECEQTKSVSIAELGRKGDLSLRTVPLKPRFDMREIRGAYNELTLKSSYSAGGQNDYLHITLTDEEDVPNAMAKLSLIYPRLMKFDYENTRTARNNDIEATVELHEQAPIELLNRFYELQNNNRMDEGQERLAAALIKKIWEKENEAQK